MATKEQIFGILAGASAPMSRVELGEKVGEEFRRFQTQIERWVKQGFVEDTGDHHYILSDKGREEALHEEIDNIPEGESSAAPGGKLDNIPEGESSATPGGKPEETQATTGTTEYQQFLRLGRFVGVVPLNLIKVTTEHIFSGGKYSDLKWVAQGLQGMGIQQDLRERWLNAWSSHLKLPLPTDLPPGFLSPESKKAEEKTEAEKKAGTGKRDYILNENDNPIYVGEGLGDLDQAVAIEIAKIRAGAKGRGAGQSKSESPGDALATKAVEKVIGDMQVSGAPADETLKVITQFKALKELLGDGKSGSGNDIERVISVIKSIRELFPENKPQTLPAQPGMQFLIDKQTGQIQQIQPGQPIIIPTAPQNPYIPIQMDKDGNPVVQPNLETWIRLEDFKGEQRRKQDSHDVKIDLAKSVKDAVSHLGKALANMGEEEK